MGLLDRLRGSPHDRFARRVLTALRDAGVAQARYLPEQFAIELRRGRLDESPTLAYLGNLFRECERAPRSERRDRVAAYLSAVIHNPGIPGSWEEVAPLLRPLLRTVTFGIGVPASAPRPLRRPAWPQLAEFVVVDQPTTIMYVTARQAEEWGVPESTIFARARRNQTSIAERTAETLDAGPGRLLRLVEDGDAYWSSHLFVDGWLAELGVRLGARPVVFVPDTTGVFVVGADGDPDGLAKLFALVEAEYREAPRPVSPMAYTVDAGGSVVPLDAPPGDPLHAVVHRAEVLLASSEYSAQADHLSTDAFVAACTLAQRPDGSVFSVASWADGVDTLLPRADYVAFGSAGAGEPFFVAWDDVAREVDLEPEEELVPERYRLPQWPHPGVVERLRKAATHP